MQDGKLPLEKKIPNLFSVYVKLKLLSQRSSLTLITTHGESNMLIRVTGTDRRRINKVMVMFVSYYLHKF